MDVHVDASQVTELAGLLDIAAAATGPGIEAAVHKTALDIEATAKGLAPVDTGALRNSISTDISGGAGDVTAVVGPTVSYAEFQELGTSRMAPHPFLAPAFDRHLPLLETALGDVLMDIL